MKVFVVHSYRWGDRECHSYQLGVYSSEKRAWQVAEYEAEWRGGKYECEIIEYTVDEPNGRVVKALPRVATNLIKCREKE